MIRILNKIEGIDDIKSILYKTKNDIASIDNTIIGRNYIEYKNISTNIQSLGVDFELNFLFQADLVKPTISNSINKSISTNVIQALSILNRLAYQDEKTNLTQFREAFNNRYEGKEVSLTEALDTETGIGYLQGNKNIGDICPLVNEVYIPVEKWTYSEIKWDHLSSFILKKYLNAIKNDSNEIILTDEEIATLPDSGNILPDTLGCMLQLSEDKIHISNVGGSSAANLISRFCHSDEEIHLFAREITEKEQQLNQNVIYAEIVHLPKARAGNVLLRPILRNFEIPYLARPYIEKNQQISLDDLMISVHGGKIMLRSKRLGKEIVPRLTTAHNYSQDALPIYHFLCDLQTQNTNSRIGFSWGIFQNEFSFLPRVSYKNIILSLAQWNLNKDDFRELLNVERSLLAEKFIEWHNKFRLPRYFSLIDGDNELVIDSKNKLCVETFIDTIKKRNYIKLSEFFFEKNKSIVLGNEGCYTNELIVAFYKIKKEIELDNFVVPLTNLPETNIKQSIKRSFFPGDEWLYLKFYMGTLIADQFIVQILNPFTEDLLKDNIIDKFYFIRYYDPDYHIRIRFHCSDTASSSCIFARIRKHLLEFVNTNLIWKVQSDTYNREIERYGTNKIQLSETLFFYESQMIVDTLKFLLEEDDDSIRWQFSLKAIDTYLDDFHYDLYQKMNFMQILSVGYDKEFHMNKELRYTLSKQYRKDRPLIDEALDSNSANAEKWGNYSKLIMKRSNAIINLVNEIISMKKEAFPEVTMNELLGSYIHMLCNRLFRSKHRLQELVIYTYLFNYYKSQIARLKN